MPVLSEVTEVAAADEEKIPPEPKSSRGVSFEAIVLCIANSFLLDIAAHPDQVKYPGQKIFIVELDNYAYLVPFAETDEIIYLKTIIPSRKATRKYIGGDKS